MGSCFSRANPAADLPAPASRPSSPPLPPLPTGIHDSDAADTTPSPASEPATPPERSFASQDSDASDPKRHQNAKHAAPAAPTPTKPASPAQPKFKLHIQGEPTPTPTPAKQPAPSTPKQSKSSPPKSKPADPAAAPPPSETTAQPLEEAKILLLGSGESGKSTILKQMRIIHQGGFTPAEVALYKQVVVRNTVESAQLLLAAAKGMGFTVRLGMMPAEWVEADTAAAGGGGMSSEATEAARADLMGNLPSGNDFSVPMDLPADRAPPASASAAAEDPGPADEDETDDRVLDLDEILGAAPLPPPTAGPSASASPAAAAAADNKSHRSKHKKHRKHHHKHGKSSTFATKDLRGGGGFELGGADDSDSEDYPSPPPGERGKSYPKFFDPEPPLPPTESEDEDREEGEMRFGGERGREVEVADALGRFVLEDGKGAPEWVAFAIEALWAHPCIANVMRRSSSFYMMENGPYYFKSVHRVLAKHYVPTTADILRSRIQTRGVTFSSFNTDTIKILMYDVGGQRAERRKWIAAFQNVRCIIFCVSLAEYDQFLFENPTQNRMRESIKLFEAIITSRWFQNCIFIVFFNKMDLFEEKLKRVNLQHYFEEYTGGTSSLNAAKYIVWRYKQANKNGAKVYSHLTTATDTDRIGTCMSAVRETIMDRSLKECGLI